MEKAVWIIAICQIIRIVQNTIQLIMCKADVKSHEDIRKHILEEIKSLDAEREDRFWQMACGDD